MLKHETGTSTASENGLVLLSPAVDYRMADEWFALANADHFWFQWRLRALERLLGRQCLEPPALEVGCGHGVPRSQLEAAYDCPIDACDINLTALKLAPAGRGGLYFYDVHCRRDEWHEHYGTIVLLDTLEHVDDPVRFLESLAWHLKPGGWLAINVPAIQLLYSRYDDVQGHKKRYSRKLLRKELEAAGFSLVRSAYWGGLLVPVAAARKVMLRFIPPERAVDCGFRPNSQLADRFLRGLMMVELGIGLSPPLGTSLLGLARKCTRP